MKGEVMKVKVRGGYEVTVNGALCKGGKIVDIDEATYQARHWVFDLVPEKKAPAEVAAQEVDPGSQKEEEVVAEAVAEQDASNRSMASPGLKRKKLHRA
jgi:hypothetical protein